MGSLPTFHYAFKVRDIESTRQFYENILGCKPGRSTDKWIDFEFFGHQISAHVRQVSEPDYNSVVDGDNVPVPHFGCILDESQFDTVAERLIKHKVQFIIEPRTRFEGEVGEQKTLFIKDPSGNALEFKSYKNPQDVFKGFSS